MKNILVYVEAAEGKAKNVGLEILTPAKVAADGGEVMAVVIGKDVEGAAKQAIAFGADKAVVVAGDDYEVYNTDVYTNALVEVVKKYAPKAVFVGATPDGKDLAAKAAAKVGSGCVTNVTGVALDGDKIVYTSPVYAGAVLNDDVCESEIEFALLRSGAFKKAEPDEAKAGEIINEAIVCPADAIKTKVVDIVKEISETVNLEEAEVIVAGGRGVGSAENFAILKELADALAVLSVLQELPSKPAGFQELTRLVSQVRALLLSFTSLAVSQVLHSTLLVSQVLTTSLLSTRTRMLLSSISLTLVSLVTFLTSFLLLQQKLRNSKLDFENLGGDLWSPLFLCRF